MVSQARNRNDSYNQFYENMRLTEPGDLVFSFYDQRIQHLAIVQSRAVTAPKPTEFAGAGDYWNEEGWLVPVQWLALPLPYRPKDIISVLKPLLPAKYSPLQQSGDGLQSVYLAAVPEPMAKVLLDQMSGFSLAVLDTARTSGDDDGVVRTVDDAIEKVKPWRSCASNHERLDGYNGLLLAP